MPPDDNTVKLIEKYCVTTTLKAVRGNPDPDETPPEQDTPEEMQNHRTEAFIDGVSYFTAIRREAQTLCRDSEKPDRFFYMAVWWLGLSSHNGTLRVNNEWDFPVNPAFFSDFPLPGAQSLAHWVDQMAKVGVDVRVLPWVSPVVSNKDVATAMGGIAHINFHTLTSVSKLRHRIGAERVVLNLLGHTFGCAHCKMVICGDRTSMRAYTSGLDPAASRLEPPGVPLNEVNSHLKLTLKADDAFLRAMNRSFMLNEMPSDIYFLLKQLVSSLPDYSQFNHGVRYGKYSYKIDECSQEQGEWKFTLIDQVDDRNPKIHIWHLQTDKHNNLYFYQWPRGGWHDCGVRVEGSAAGAMHDFFIKMWNEQLGRGVETFKLDGETIVSHDRAWQPLPFRRPIDPPATGRQYVQVLRTIPRMNFQADPGQRGKRLLGPDFMTKVGIEGLRLKLGTSQLAIPAAIYAGVQKAYARRPLGFAPQGRFEFKVALKKAISAAEQYIFIADQDLYALEVMDWINAAVQRKPTLKVILLYGRDPADAPKNFLSEAINNHLLCKVPRHDDLGSQPRNIVFYEWTGNVVHCKLTIIDDTWCAIGSANCMRRSLYTDIELSVSILEPPTPPDLLPTTPEMEKDPDVFLTKAPSFVQGFRRDLWAHYCGVPLDPAQRVYDDGVVYAQLLNLQRALACWNLPHWGAPLRRGTYSLTLRPEITRRNLAPFPTSGPFKQEDYDRLDPDSRQPF